MNRNGSSLQEKARRHLKIGKKEVENHAGGKNQAELEYVLFITVVLSLFFFILL